MDSHGWDARYEEKELVWPGEPNLFLPPIVESLTPGTALDLACGEGRNAIWLARGGWDVTAVDFSPVGIEKGRQIAGDTSVEWVVADVTSYEAERRFDLVMIVYVHMLDDDTGNLFDRAITALAPGGTLIGVGHALRNLTEGVGGPPYPEILWTAERIAPFLKGLDIVELAERLRPVDDSDIPAIDLLIHATKP
ncbi:MAG: class I SAM-dependent methyltransferase [Actinomycetota bacterium]|nr:class I SAM-dependent methyltransferase [Actinomycetota bacterium]